MQTDVPQRPFSGGVRVILLVTRILTATLLTALVGAVANWLYERFFAPDLYAAGPPLARAVEAVALTFPFVLAGLLVFGLPAAYLLRIGRLESAISYAAAGAVTGATWGATFDVVWPFGYAAFAFYGCTCALFWWLLRPRA